MNLLGDLVRRITQQALKAFAKIRLIYLKTKGKIKIINESGPFSQLVSKKVKIDDRYCYNLSQLTSI